MDCPAPDCHRIDEFSLLTMYLTQWLSGEKISKQVTSAHAQSAGTELGSHGAHLIDAVPAGMS